MQVLHYTENFSKTSETFVYNYISGIERQEPGSSVVTHKRKNQETRPFPRITVLDKPNQWDPRRVYHRLRLWGTEHPSLESFWPQTRERMETVVRDMQPDVIHAHFGPQGVRIAPVAEALRIPLVVTFYGSDMSVKPSNDFWAEKYQALWPRVDGVTVLSEDMKQKAQQAGCSTSKISVVHLSCNLDDFPFDPSQRPVRRVLFVGRLVPKKAPIDALEAVRYANREEGNLHLDIVGDGPLQKEVKRYVEEHRMDTVTLHGRVPSSEVARHMGEADAFLLPSKTAPNGDQEGTPTVLVEAQATGLPCVTTRHTGIPEMIPEENHDLLSAPGDVKSLAQTLTKLSNASVDEIREIGKRGRLKVERDFNLSREVRKLRALYREVVGVDGREMTEHSSIGRPDST